ncbi:MAG: RagB/SusD family nutrient uptake outer membrane protein [Paludibacteraceae bacterium]|nr:RagB/SusD family nutrient uptake outer membrane protein [Paludibacteraceae bacterium]
MKKIKFLFATIVLGLALTSCGDSFLTQYPEGSVLLEDQYQKLPDKLQGAVLGIYTKLYEYGGHSTFGKRSLDMYSDIQSGDMAMKRNSYGWFESYERGYYYSAARSYTWSYFYEIINLANICDVAIADSVQAIWNATTSTEDPSDEIALSGYFYGQILAMRGWSYAYLLDIFTDPRDVNTADLDADAIPVYVGTDVKAGTLGAPLSTVTEVYDRAYQDLSEAIQLLDYYGKYNQRGSKLEVDADVARLMLAYAMLNHGDKNTIVADGKNCYEIALENAKAVIDGGKYPMLKKAELTTTGFADVSAANWMWGQDVTVETTTALGSFFGQVDVHSYSYAAAGDTKGIDSKLYDEIDKNKWDARIKWFRTGSQKFPYCPDGKFYSPKYKNVTALDQVDRNWLCDNVFMRVESAYLIAAEAAWSNGDNATAVNYLKALCDERVADGKDTEYNTWLASLTSSDAVKEAIIYNWRVEMWGEGYSMQVLRRIQKQRTLGSNHLARANKALDINGTDKEMFQCQIPTSETRYNPFIGDKTTLQNED